MSGAVLAAVLTAGCSGHRSAATAATSMPGVTVFTASRRPLPPISGRLVSGGKLALTADRGHVVVLNFWGSWCTVCRREAPVLSAAARRLRGSGVRFVGVDVADNTASAVAYLHRYGISYPSLTDPGGRVAAEFNQLIPVAALPSTLVISPGGRIAGRIIGAATAGDLRRLIRAAR